MAMTIGREQTVLTEKQKNAGEEGKILCREG